MRRKAFLVITGLVLGITESVIGWLLAPANFLGYLLIFTGLFYCIGGSIFLAATRPQAGDKQQKELNFQSDRTLLMLMPGALIILLAAPLEYALIPAALPRSWGMQWAGLAIILLGFALRLWVRQSLKEAYQGNLQVQHQQHLVTGGPYQWVRHPGYLGFILMAVGLAVGFSSLIGLFGVVLLAIGFLLRSQVEERMLVQVFGEPYITYAEHTGRMVPRMITHTAVPSYAAEAPRHLRTYDWIVRRIRRPLAQSSLAAAYGADWLDAVFADTRAEFARLVPQIPYIGESNVWKLNIVAVTMYLALYRVLKGRGWPVETAGQFIHQAHEAFAGSFPRWLRHLVGWAQFTPWFVRRMKAGAERSQMRRYPMDWVFDWTPGDGKNFDYGFDIRECAVVKFYQQQGAEELTPQLCIMDHFLADAMGYQFRREGVLAAGSPCCDCRYTHSAGSNDWPPTYPLHRSH